MNKENKLVPELRFPEFKDEQSWGIKKLKQISQINPTSNKLPESFVYIDLESVHSGILLQKKFISLVDAPSRAQRLLNDGDIIFQMVRPYQKNNYLFLDSGDNFKYVASTGYAQIRAHESNTYLYHYLHNELFVKRVFAKCTGSNYPAISSSDIAEIYIEIPQPKEQKKIASCLSSLDELINAHTLKLDALKDHKKGLMQQLFPAEGETVPILRFPEFEDDLKPIGFAELGDIKIGLTHTPKYIESGIPFLSSKNISSGYIDFKNIQFISEEEFVKMPESTKPKIGDILFTRVGSNLGNPIILEEDREFAIFVSLGFFRANSKAFNHYIKYWMESDYFWTQLKQKVAGGAKDNLNSTWLREFKLAIPSFIEQQKIASCLSSVDKQIAEQTQKIKALKEHKMGLMQGLFPIINE